MKNVFKGLVVLIVMVFPSVGFAATVVDAGLGGTVVTTGTADVLAVTGTITQNGVSVATSQDVNNEASARTSADAAEATARAAADSTLQNNINSETAARAASDLALQSNINAISADTDSFQNKISHLDGRIDEVGSLSAAFSSLVPNVRAKGNTQLSLGLGNYGGSNAAAAGLFHYVSDNVLVNAGASSSFSSGDTATRIGLTIGF